MEEPKETAEAVMENDFEAQEDSNYNANQRPFETFVSSQKDLVQEFVTVRIFQTNVNVAN